MKKLFVSLALLAAFVAVDVALLDAAVVSSVLIVVGASGARHLV